MKKHKIITAFLILSVISTALLSGCRKSSSANDIPTAEETDNTTKTEETTKSDNIETYHKINITQDTEEWGEYVLNGLGKYAYPGFELTYREIDGVSHRCLIDEEGNYIIFIGSEYDDTYQVIGIEEERIQKDYRYLFKIGTKESEADLKWKYGGMSRGGPTVMKCQLNGEGAHELILKDESGGGGEEWAFIYVFDTDNMREITVGQDGDLRSELREAVELPEGYSCGRVVNVYVENGKMFAVISIDKINENAIQNDTEKYYSVQLEYDSEANRLKLQEEGRYISCEQYERLIVGDAEAFLEAYSAYAEYIEEKYADAIDENDPRIEELEEYRRRINECEDEYERARAFGAYADYLEMMALTNWK